MCWTRIRVSAFSLIELLVVLVLSSLVVSIVYFVYYTVSTYHMNLMKKQESVNEIGEFYFLLSKDFERSELISAMHESEVICQNHDPHRRVTYSFFPTYVLRMQNERQDTFHIVSEDSFVFWQGERIRKFPTATDELEFRVLGLLDTTEIHLVKYYDAASLLLLTQKDSLP